MADGKGYRLNIVNPLIFTNEPKESFISVIVPVFQDEQGLKTLLSSLEKQTLSREWYEIIVANDGGAEEITHICRRHGTRMVEIMPNGGSYFARNRAVEISKGEYLAFTDSDVTVPPDWLQKGLQALKKWDYAAGEIWIDREKILNLTHYYQQNASFLVEDYMKNEHFGPTANLFIRRKLIQSVGGFDERLFSSGDHEFGERVSRESEFKQVYRSDLMVFHPPRDYRQLMIKYDRVAAGKRQLNSLYPKRFAYRSFLKILKHIIFPRKINTVKKLFKGSNMNMPVLFFFCWWMRAAKNMYYLKHFFKQYHQPPPELSSFKVKEIH
ncbi:glycosyltransferase [Candidatus Contubernalis alkaliaceticus]|uniref:glycosyltransferase n=1 Tax=Candidatus Contubernalis alkaliaceticus TaxID=338645 RepID=UPI001F4BF6DC|nr:glycosyltransferase family A protein [Candidatus Contubernalis alkalaceticus]UNC93586.1 glycosyltransferase family 2 protein [Candidatus Contubernalis alkalaceticus]